MEYLVKLFKKHHTTLVVVLSSLVVYMISSQYDILENFVEFSRSHETFELDEIVTVSIYLVFVMGYLLMRRALLLKKNEMILIKRNGDLEDAVKKIKKLEGILPICAECKKIKDEDGNWNQMESYIHRHSEADFSHGLCPDCAEEYMKDI